MKLLVRALPLALCVLVLCWYPSASLLLAHQVGAQGEDGETRIPADSVEESKDYALQRAIEELLGSVRPAVTFKGMSGGALPESPRFSTDEDGYLRSLGAPPDCYFAVSSLAPDDPQSIARNFLADQGLAFGITSSSVDFKMLEVDNEDNRSYVRLQQTYEGLPVFGGEVVVQLNSCGGVESVLTDIMRDPQALDAEGLSTRPSISAADAQQAAIGLVLGFENADFELQASAPALLVYEPSIVGNSGPTQLVWQTTVSGVEREDVRELVLVDAHTGEVAFHYPLTNAAIDREVYDAENMEVDPGTLARAEGDLPSGITDVDQAYDYLGDTYYFYLSHHGRDSIDGAGMTMSTTVRLPSYYYAFWDSYSERMYFGDGWAADDVVAHELTHGVTQYESALVYYEESGAINEAFSDMWGEWVDQENGAGTDTPGVKWLLGEDTPIGAIRDMADPTAFGHPDRMGSPYWDEYGEVHTNSGVGNKLAYLLTDGDTFNGYIVTGMGVGRVADLFYEAQTNLLSAGADYADLYYALTQAAINLGWGSSDRQNLRRACLAVEITDNSPPVAGDDTYDINEDLVLNVGASGVLADDYDIDGDDFTATLATDVSSGILVLYPDGSFTYTTGQDFFGVDSFTYTAYDGSAHSGEATVTITVNPVPDDPEAGDDSSSTPEDTPVTIDVLANDGDVDGDTISVQSVTPGDHGTVTNDSSDVIYTPDADFNEGDIFNYTISDGNGGTDTAAVTVTVTSVNDSPTDISLTSSTVAEGEPADTAVGILSTTDPDTGDSHSYSLVSGDGDTDNESFSIVGSELRTNSIFDHEIKNSYMIRVHTDDGNGATFEKQFTITITNVNDAPEDINLSGSNVTEKESTGAVVGTFSTVDPDTNNGHTYSLVPGVGDDDNGAFVVVGDQLRTNSVFDYETQNAYSIRVQTDDGNGGIYQKQFTVTITDVNEAPAADPKTVATDEGTALAITLTGSDVDGGALTFSVVDHPSHGTLTGAAPNLTYAPDPDYDGPDNFTFKANDGMLDSSPATVTITVNPVEGPVDDDEQQDGDQDGDQEAEPGEADSDGGLPLWAWVLIGLGVALVPVAVAFVLRRIMATA